MAASEQDAGTRAPRFVGRHTHLFARGLVELSPGASVNVFGELRPRQGLERPALAVDDEHRERTGRATLW